MASGVAINDEVNEAYQQMKSKKKISYLIFKIADLKEIVVDHRGPEEGDGDCYQEFLDKLKEAEDNGECRYAVYDFKYQKNNQTNQKLVFFLWNPDSAKIKSRMLYASSKDALSKALKEGKMFEQVNSLEDLNKDEWCKKLADADRA